MDDAINYHLPSSHPAKRKPGLCAQGDVCTGGCMRKGTHVQGVVYAGGRVRREMCASQAGQCYNPSPP